MNKEISTKLSNQLSLYETQVFRELLSAHNISSTQFKQIVLSEIKKNEKLMEIFIVNPSSLFASIIFAAQIGLMPSETIGQIFLIPFKGICKPIIGYQGLVTLLLRDVRLRTISCEVVCEGDEFDYELGLTPKLFHKPKDELRSSESMTHIYCVANYGDGIKEFKVMSRKEINTNIEMLKNPNELYYNDKKDGNMWMLKKIVLKQLSKLMNKDYYCQLAIKMDDALEGGRNMVLDENNNPVITIEEKRGSIYQTLS